MVGVTVAGVAAAAVSAPCPPDLDGDGAIGGSDLSVLLAGWGLPGPADLDGDGAVGGVDLAIVLSSWGPCPGGHGMRPMELAAAPRAVPPHATAVQAFLPGAKVQVAVDPARVPEIVGATVRVFVTADRSAAEWTADPTLVDVRGAGELVTFGATLADCVRPLATESLPGPAGIAFARGYDLVVDLDGSGTLSDGDLIDGLDGPGFSVVANASVPGPYAVSQISSWSVGSAAIPSNFQLQRVYYPTAVATLPALPLVVISHGNGHSYTWYDYLGTHLASWGFVVMAHQNYTSAGIETASTTTLVHTDALLGAQATLAGGVLDGKIDARRIAWIGHSRGGEGVARAYDRMVDGTYTPARFTRQDIFLVSSIAPTDFLGPASANPHDANYHLLYGASDGDVCGCPDSDVGNSFNLYERAIGERMSTYVHGADHNDFNCCGFDDFAGPIGTAIGRPAAQVLARATYLTLLRYLLDADPVAGEFFWRQYEDLRPAGVGGNIIAALDRKPKAAAIIDDFQTQPSLGTSSSGGAVTLTVLNAVEGLMNDNNTSFTWLTSDPWNGMTRGRTSDTTRGLVFDWTEPSSIEFEMVPALRDFSERTFLSLRAAQGTRHVRTVALAGPVRFSVTLVDAEGRESSLDIAVTGAGVQRPYQRTGYGTGAGWQNEFETLRLRLADFLAGGRELDLSAIVRVRLSFGGEAGSAEGRLAIDDLTLLDG